MAGWEAMSRTNIRVLLSVTRSLLVGARRRGSAPRVPSVAVPALLVAGLLGAQPAVPAQPLEAPGPWASTEGPGPCAFAGPPRVLVDEERAFLQYWVEGDRPVLHSGALPDSPSLHAFRDRVSGIADTDPRALLATQLDQVSGGDAENVRRILEGEVGTIRPITCLEALLLSVQTDRGAARGAPMFEDPTEFLSYVLRRDDTLKVYFYTVDQPGIGGLGNIHQPVRRDVDDGWTLVTNIHNHNFFPGTDRLLGGVAPSATDVQALGNAARTFGLPVAVITNGFDSLELTADELQVLAGPEG